MMASFTDQNPSLAEQNHHQPRTGRPLIAITMGDPAGIGAEVIVKALADPDIRKLARFLILGLEDTLDAAADAAAINPFWFEHTIDQAAKIDSGVAVAHFDGYEAGYWVNARPTAMGGKASLAFVDAAIDLASRGVVDAIVTAPIHKTGWKLAGCRFPGHTEKIANALRAKRHNMAFVGGGLRIALATTHIPLLELRNHLTIGLVFQPLDLLNEALVHWFGVDKPHIAVAGLNPHAGEDGRFGDEEKRIIEPAILMAQNAGINATGPYPADTLFTPKMRNKFDGIVALYHDQGLIPIKMLAFDSAVNVTLGLPTIRTSVDHGTAFDIAGTNSANPGSMKEAILLACMLAQKSRTSNLDSQGKDKSAIPLAATEPFT